MIPYCIVMITFAIGDVHGCLPLLTKLIDLCRDYAFRNSVNHRFILLGDYVDKGPFSAQTLDFLMRWQAEANQEVILLKGNHEQLFVSRAPKGTSGLPLETQRSFDAHNLDVEKAAEFVDRLPIFVDDGVHYFVHAGVDPEKSLADQDDDRMWIRNEFLTHNEMFERYIVHGHTPTKPLGVPQTLHNRCGLDTGAFLEGGALTCGVFDDEHRRPLDFLSVKHDGPLVLA